MIPFCPNCNKLVLGSHRKSGKVFCPHCKNEIVMSIRKKYLFVAYFVFAFLPFIFSEYFYRVFNIHGYFSVYFFLYLLSIFFLSVLTIKKNVSWERGEDYLE